MKHLGSYVVSTPYSDNIIVINHEERGERLFFLLEQGLLSFVTKLFSYYNRTS